MPVNLDANFWDQKYLNDDTPWNIRKASPPLTDYIDQLKDKTINILIPGAGHAHEVNYLLEKGFKNITILFLKSVNFQNIYYMRYSVNKCVNFKEICVRCNYNS